MVQFLRERDFTCVHVLASDYRIQSVDPLLLTPAENHKASAPSKTPQKEVVPIASPPSEPTPILTETKKSKSQKSKRARRDTKAIYDSIAKRLQALPAGTQLSRSDFRELLREIGLKSKKDLPGQNFKQFIERLVRRGYLTLEGDTLTIATRP